MRDDPQNTAVKTLHPAKSKTQNAVIKPDIGLLAENFVAQWLIDQGWEILQRRWRCRWGELDLIARQAVASPPASNSQASLVFVEVKARSKGNWDENGLLAITPKKQAKLCQAAQLFLAAYSHLAEFPCRFDVALVNCQQMPILRERSPKPQQPTPTPSPSEEATSPSTAVSVKPDQPAPTAHYRLILQQYIPAAFDH